MLLREQAVQREERAFLLRALLCLTMNRPCDQLVFVSAKAMIPALVVLGLVAVAKCSSVLEFGYLTHKRYPQVLGAVSLAVENINKDASILPNVTLKFKFANLTHLDKLEPLRWMSDFRDSGVAAFIGPDETCRNEALVASAWNLPMIAFKCSDSALSNKTEYPTFARTMQPSKRIAKSIISVLRHFKWNRVVVLAGEHSKQFIYIKDAFVALADKYGINVNDTFILPDFYREDYKETFYKDVVEYSKDKTRIYVFIGENVALLDLMSFLGDLHDKGDLNLDDYVVLAVDNSIDDSMDNTTECHQFIAPPWSRALYHTQSGSNSKRFARLYRSVLRIVPAIKDLRVKKKMMDAIKDYSTKAPFFEQNHSFLANSIVPMEAVYTYDAVKVYALAAHQIMSQGGDIRNGTEVVNAIVRMRAYPSDILGINVTIDSNADSEGSSMLLAMVESPKCGTKFETVGDFVTENDHEIPELRLNFSRKIMWTTKNESDYPVPPLGKPSCGFDNEHCKLATELVFGLIFLFAMVLILIWFGIRHYQYEQKLARLLWKVDFKDILTLQEKMEQSPYNINERDLRYFFPKKCSSFHHQGSRTATVGVYRGNVVVIRRVNKKTVDLNRTILKELNSMRDLRHENLVPFIGACVETGHIAILTQLCARGNLHHVLNNSDYRLDNMFIASLVGDLIRGMIYLHESEIVYHGNLKPANCLVDSRWVLQISDFGLRHFKAGEDMRIGVNRFDLLWKAPEFLRSNKESHHHSTVPAPSLASLATAISAESVWEPISFVATKANAGSQKGDVYSFALILYEIIGRKGPWGKVFVSSREVSFLLNKLRNPAIFGEVRPSIDVLSCEEYIKKCIVECWKEDPSQRPDFRSVRNSLRALQAGLKPNIFDNMVAILEKHASNLEKQVAERTHLLTEEKKKTDALLYSMLPRPVADDLKQGRKVEAESFECVTIYFSDVVDFTSLSATSTPMQVVTLLNDLYTCFDSIIEAYDVYKVETIGDAYMVVSWNEKMHASEVASMALHLMQEIKFFAIPHRPVEFLKLRVGLHSGPCVAGVVGRKMPRYCLFGDTVNTASRMESSGEPCKIHMSDQTKQILDTHEEFTYEERGIIKIKGKGNMRTFWLTGRNGGKKRLSTTEGKLQVNSEVATQTKEKADEKFDLIQDIEQM